MVAVLFLLYKHIYNFFPLVLRKLLTNISLFKPKNKVELESVRRELINLNEQDTMELMNYIFDAPYNHLDIDTNNNELRKNALYKLIV